MKKIEDISRDAEYYASRIRTNLIKDPIEGVDPVIISNAHRMGYVHGASDMNYELMRAEGEIDSLRSRIKVIHWQMVVLIVFIIILECVIMLK